MINNVVDQILGRAGRMQVAGARTGLAHTLGGPARSPAWRYSASPEREAPALPARVSYA